MSADFAEKEREFVSSLAADTGRDLSGWMTAIAQSGLTARNDIIDWLRHQRFTFAKASWLERIHNNGGRLIYEDATAAAAALAPSREPARQTGTNEAGRATQAGDIDLSRATLDIAPLLAGAKGLRPLAEMIIGEIRTAAPGTTFVAHGPLIVAVCGPAFLAILAEAKKIKIYADFNSDPARLAVPADAINKSAAPFTRMIELNDARRIDGAFRALLLSVAPVVPLQRRA